MGDLVRFCKISILLLIFICQNAAAGEREHYALHVGKTDGQTTLWLSKNSSPISSLLLPREFEEKAVAAGLKEAVWNRDKTAVLVIIDDPRASFIAAFARYNEGTWRASDLSRIEDGSFGKLGGSRLDYVSFKTTVLGWIRRPDKLYKVKVETKAVDSKGRVSTASEPFLLSKKGAPIWR